MNIVYLVLALVSATFAVPIMNNIPQPLSSEVMVEPRVNIPAALIVTSVLAETAYIAGRLVQEKVRGDELDLRVLCSKEFRTFGRKAQELDNLTPSHFTYHGAESNDDTIVPIRFILPRGETRVKHDTKTAPEATKKILSRHLKSVELIELEGGQLSANEVFGVAIDSGIKIASKRRVVQCPCHLWLRVWETSGNVYAVFISHANPGESEHPPWLLGDICRPDLDYTDFGLMRGLQDKIQPGWDGQRPERLEIYDHNHPHND
ncbi:hypothetical protein F5878DRAFT_451186 [Lentinula raphanica]|uniref:Uncharacterized protein n=1 Tax=Lentinula raphanica TaxID=153919 RepID=A0AA38PEZ0_9AGAR|nr:hypothetical protein F5878DRAFT_451186 [Lentinula raphanica]